jgi:arylsulfatase A-like enzyme
MSDNGFMLGEHRIRGGKKVLYEPSARVPLQLRGPTVPVDASVTKMAGLMDFAPTVLDLAQVPAAPTDLGIAMDGRSLTGTFDNVAGARPVVLEDHADVPPTGSSGWLERGLDTEHWAYIKFPPQNGFEELYDLNADPYERVNLAGRAAYAGELQRIRQQWTNFKDCAGATCQ